MKHIFYFLSIGPLLYEAMVLMEPAKLLRFKERMKSIKYDNMDDNQKSFSWCVFIYILWNVIGLFSFQWWAFVVIFLLGLIPKKWPIPLAIDAFITMVVILFIILNQYHFHLSLKDLIHFFNA